MNAITNELKGLVDSLKANLAHLGGVTRENLANLEQIADLIGKPPKPTVDLSVGKTIRIQAQKPHPHSLWVVTGHALGATRCENLVTLRRLDIDAGSLGHESIVPMAILSTHPFIENP